jgi:Carboxypeptidase regulatory-like domain
VTFSRTFSLTFSQRLFFNTSKSLHFQRTAELIKNKPKFSSTSIAARRRFPLRYGILVFLMLATLATHARSQQTPLKLQAYADLPDAPQAQTEPQTQSQAQSPPSPAPQPPEQSSSGSIHGVIVDRDGAVYQGVRITLTQPVLATIPEISATSDSNGRFDFADVPAGPFQLTIAANGFATQKISGLLHSGESYEGPNIVLLVTSATTDVQVTASRFEIAEEELKTEEQQRVFGIIPNFYVVYAPNAPPLSSKQKFRLAWKSWTDPVNIAIDGGIAGFQQANNDYSGYGQGSEGYAKRFGAVYGTDFVGDMLGGAVLPSLLKQDPRYFYKGTGSTRSRAFYAIANSVICKSDRGHWQPNYSGILGGLAAGGISNLYYPAADRNGASLTFENAILGVASSAVSNLFQEFLVRKLTPKVPNYSSSKP